MEEKNNEFIVGRHAVDEALADRASQAQELLVLAGDRSAALRRIIEVAREHGIRFKRVERTRLEELSQGAAHQGVALRMAAARYADFGQILRSAQTAGQRALVILADHLQDPHNLGAVVRSAAAAGAQGVVVPKDRACPLTPAVAKAAAGALGRMPVARVANLSQALDKLKKAGMWGLAAVTKDAPPPWKLDLDMPLALVVGGEHKGVGERLLKACELRASLPLAAGVESLNASVAAGIMLFEILRQRGGN